MTDHLDQQRDHNPRLQQRKILPQAVARALDERHKLRAADISGPQSLLAFRLKGESR